MTVEERAALVVVLLLRDLLDVDGFEPSRLPVSLVPLRFDLEGDVHCRIVLLQELELIEDLLVALALRREEDEVARYPVWALHLPSAVKWRTK